MIGIMTRITNNLTPAQLAEQLFIEEMTEDGHSAQWAAQAWADMTFPADDWSDEALEYLWEAEDILEGRAERSTPQTKPVSFYS